MVNLRLVVLSVYCSQNQLIVDPRENKLPNLLLAERISSSMRASNKTIEQVVGEVGCSKNAYHKWVKTGHIDVNNIIPLAEALSVHPFYFTEVITGQVVGPTDAPLSNEEYSAEINNLSDSDLALLLKVAAARLLE